MYCRYSRLIEEISIQLERCRAQWNVTLNSRNSYLEDLLHLAKTRLRFKPDHYPRFKILPHLKNFLTKISDIEIEHNENGTRAVALRPVAFVHLFHLVYLKETVDKRKIEIDGKVRYWAEKLKRWKYERYCFTSNFERHGFGCAI